MSFIGTSGSDVLDGSADPDEIDGLEGDDHLYGHGGNDSLYGNDGNDVLAGGSDDDLLDGGAGNDTLWGGDGCDSVVFRDGYGHDVIMDFDVTGGLVYLNSAGIETWADVQAHLSADYDGTAILILDDGSTLRFEGLSIDQLTEANFILPPPPVCFAAGSLIRTPLGDVMVDTLQPGDLVMTLDHGPQPLLWIGRRHSVFGHGRHRHQPMRISTGALGHGLPFLDLLVSPQHRILVQGPPGNRFAKGGLAKAKGLSGRPGITQETTCTAIEYFQLLLPQHSVLIANGLAAESFLPRAFAMASLDAAARAAILRHFPALDDAADTAYGPPARPLMSMKLLAALPAIAGVMPAATTTGRRAAA